MSRSMKIDQFAQDSALDEFARFQGDVFKTADALGLYEPDQSGYLPLVVGSAALAVQGLDARVNKHGYTSDLDVVVSLRRFGELYDTGVLAGANKLSGGIYMGWTDPTADKPLPVEVLASEDPNGYASIGYPGREGYKGEPNKLTRVVNGLHVLGATAVVADKLSDEKPRVKDVGNLKAHFVGVKTGHELVNTKAWRMLVGVAIGKVMTNSVYLGLEPLWRQALRRPDYPGWLSQLKRARFEHPAFHDIPK